MLTTIGLFTTGSARAAAPPLTKVRVVLSTTSDWTELRLDGVRIRVQRQVSATPGSAVSSRANGWTLVNNGATSDLVVDTIMEVPAGALPTMVVTKGRWGTATARLDVLNTTTPTTAASASVSTQSSEYNGSVVAVDPARLVGTGLRIVERDPRNLTLAFYYPWFGHDTASNPRIGPDRPVWPYATNDANHVRAMVNQAATNGVDGFLVSWQGELHGGPVDLLLDAAASRSGFVVAPLLELRQLRRRTIIGTDVFDASTVAAATRDWFNRTPPASALTVGGKRVVALFGMWDLTAEQWAEYRGMVAELNLFFIGDRADPAIAVDGTYHYDPNPYTLAELDQLYDHTVDGARLLPALDPSQRQLLWAATVSPGFDTTIAAGMLSTNRRITARNNGRRYDDTWRVALDSAPEWVFVTSWNEWFEQTHIAAGNLTGTRALQQTASWSAGF